MRLNPYVWGADTARGVVKTVRLHWTGRPEDREKAEEITRDAEERHNFKGR